METTQLPIYRRWDNVPENLKTQTQIGKLGLKLTADAHPEAIFDSRKYGQYYLYSATNKAIVITKIKRKEIVKREAFSLIEIVDCLYVLNKNVKNLKNKNEDYSLKDRVLSRIKDRADKIELHYAENSSGSIKYILRGDFEDQDEYEYELIDCDRDSKGRPCEIIDGKTYDTYTCFYFGEYSFHAPIEFGSKQKPSDEFKLIGDGDSFVSTRKIVKNVKQARENLKQFLAYDTLID